MLENNAQNSSNCFICKENYTDREPDLFYCLCDVAVCKGCIDTIKLDEINWKCPKCEKEMDVESTRLFRTHD